MAKSTKKKVKKVTPLMQQYFDVKKKYPDAILLFRVGDFYETFGEDAVTASGVLGIVLTKRNNGGEDIALAGFPYHSMDLYLPRLVRAGFRVAICEQLEKPSKEKKILKRGVTEVVTPGVATSDKLLDHRSNNYLCAVHFGKKGQAGVAFADISTGEFLVSEGDLSYVDKLIQGFKPSEVLFAKSKSKDFTERHGDKYYTFELDEWIFTSDYTREKLLNHFEVTTLKGFGIENMELSQIAAGTILHYLASTENRNISHVNAIARIEPDRYVWLDRFTIRNLELIYSNHESGVPLINILDKTISPMGARLLKKWVVLPLKSKEAIESRLDVVDYFIKNIGTATDIEQYVRQIGDLERIISKVALAKINPREVVQLQRALGALVPIKEMMMATGNDYLTKLADAINPCSVIKEQIAQKIIEEPPVNLHKGGVIANGVNAELDDYRNTSNNAKELLVEIQKTESEKTGITSLKIGFNNVFGYYLEVTNRYKNQGLIPDNWVRKQTLKGAERYITEELKTLETKILSAEEKILGLEEKIFTKLVSDLADYIQPIQHNASVIARMDCLLSFAKVATKHNYCRPEMNEGHAIDIKNGRHPVIEQQLPIDNPYVPNNVYLDKDDQQIMMITGPNMAGKSALLRQTALISLMAQMGSFVPAESAKLGWIDKVFTRVGASDNISSGESTFMVEMNETASIMNNISDRSLILLDEIGRGTSTYDGVSIAWSIAEYLHDNGIAAPKTLFATHYHELNELATKFPRIKNFSIAIKQINQKIIFLRKLVEGGSNHSFGIYVAKMAGMPRSIVERASVILTQLEKKMSDSNGNVETKDILQNIEAPSNLQLSIFETVDPVAGKLKESLEDMDLNSMTPIECMLKLNELKKMMEE
ncbi:MAG: DNA mismatch repair protein MutS [Maribacter sp.]